MRAEMKVLLCLVVLAIVGCGLKDAKKEPPQTEGKRKTQEEREDEEEKKTEVGSETQEENEAQEEEKIRYGQKIQKGKSIVRGMFTGKKFISSVRPGDVLIFSISEKILIPVVGEVYLKEFKTGIEKRRCSPSSEPGVRAIDECYPDIENVRCLLRFQDFKGWNREDGMEGRWSVEIGGKSYAEGETDGTEQRFEVTEKMVEEGNDLYLVSLPPPKDAKTVMAGFVDFGDCPEREIFDFEEDIFERQEYSVQRIYTVTARIEEGGTERVQ